MTRGKSVSVAAHRKARNKELAAAIYAALVPVVKQHGLTDEPNGKHSALAEKEARKAATAIFGECRLADALGKYLALGGIINAKDSPEQGTPEDTALYWAWRSLEAFIRNGELTDPSEANVRPMWLAYDIRQHAGGSHSVWLPVVERIADDIAWLEHRQGRNGKRATYAGWCRHAR